MSQFARPSIDAFVDSYTNEVGAAVNLFQSIDEVVADDTDFVKSSLTPANKAYVTKLSAVVDPLSSIGHILRYRIGKDVASGDRLDQTVELRQGYVSEASPGTLIHQQVHVDVGVFPIAGTFTLTAAEADSITDYTNLFIRLVSNKV
jgi:hypothetical protein